MPHLNKTTALPQSKPLTPQERRIADFISIARAKTPKPIHQALILANSITKLPKGSTLIQLLDTLLHPHPTTPIASAIPNWDEHLTVYRYTGVFIAFHGASAAGKTTAAHMFLERLRTNGVSGVVISRDDIIDEVCKSENISVANFHKLKPKSPKKQTLNATINTTMQEKAEAAFKNKQVVLWDTMQAFPSFNPPTILTIRINTRRLDNPTEAEFADYAQRHNIDIDLQKKLFKEGIAGQILDSKLENPSSSGPVLNGLYLRDGKKGSNIELHLDTALMLSQKTLL